MKRYTKWFMPVLLSVMVLAACNDDDEVTTAPNTAPTEQDDDKGTTTQTEVATDAPFKFSSFSLDVDYGVNKKVEADYDNESTGVEASYENNLEKNEKLNGDDAYKKLEPIFKSFTFDATTANDAVIAEVLKAFELQEDYKEFELEVRFADGAEKEYKVVK